MILLIADNLQTFWEVLEVAEVNVIEAFGFTNTVAVIGSPGHPLAVGVIVNVTVIGAFVVLVKVPEIFPLPLPAIPVTPAVLSLVQLYVAPATFPDMAIVVIALPEQIV